MGSWQYGYSYPTPIYQGYDNYHSQNAQKHLNCQNYQQPYPFATYGVQTPCREYGPAAGWGPYGDSVYPTQPESTTYDINYLWTDEFLLKKTILRELKGTVEYYQELEKEHIKMMHDDLTS